MDRFYNLAETALDDGEYETAVKLATRQISLDRWREAARRQLMRVLAAQGKQSAALAQYETCRTVLLDELGVKPAQETTNLYHAIQETRASSTAMPAIPARRHNLPADSTPFIGRADETAIIQQRLNSPDCRLLTLIGPGGIGKTRLALHTAASLSEKFSDGIFFIPLAAITPAANMEEQIIHAIVNAVGLTFSGPTLPRRQLAGWLQGKNILLLVDNVEHMLAGAEGMAYLLKTAVSFKILATSRQRLALSGEWLIPVHGMAYPAADDDDAERFDAMKLFWQRARMVNPYFSFSVMAKPFTAAAAVMEHDYRFQARRGVFQYQSGQLEQSETLLTAALAQAEVENKPLEIGFCTGQLGRLCYLRGKHDDALPYLQRTLTISQKMGDITLLGMATNGLTLYHTRKGELETAARYGRESLETYRRLGIPLKEVAGFVNLANIALLQGEYAEAKRLLRDCLAIGKRYQAQYAEMIVLTNLSLAVGGQERYEEASDMLERALIITRAIGHQHGEGAILNNLGCLYYDRGLYDLAYTTLQTALPVRGETNDVWGTAVTHIHIGETLTAQNKLTEAEAAILAGLKLAREAGGKTAVFDGLGALAALRLKEGDGKTAVVLAQEVLDGAEATDGAKEKARAVLASASEKK